MLLRASAAELLKAVLRLPLYYYLGVLCVIRKPVYE